METKGRLTEVEYDIGYLKITIETPNTVDVLEGIRSLADKDLKVSLTQWREPRSRSANNYFHCLSDKLADHMRMSKPKMKNYLLFHYGQKVRDENNELVIVKTNADEEKLISRTDIHLWHLKDAPDGTPLYSLLEHSRFYDSLQMSILLDGTIEECKALGIEVLPPDEIERMKQTWNIEGFK